VSSPAIGLTRKIVPGFGLGFFRRVAEELNRLLHSGLDRLGLSVRGVFPALPIGDLNGCEWHRFKRLPILP